MPTHFPTSLYFLSKTLTSKQGGVDHSQETLLIKPGLVCMAVILVLEKTRQEDQVQTSPGQMVKTGSQMKEGEGEQERKACEVLIHRQMGALNH